MTPTVRTTRQASKTASTQDFPLDGTHLLPLSDANNSKDQISAQRAKRIVNPVGIYNLCNRLQIPLDGLSGG